MVNIHRKKGVTLLALVITIVIMLLLTGVVIQMSIGENGLITKSAEAKSRQAKTELYDVAKLEFLSRKMKAIENNQPYPNAEEVLSDINFLERYDIVGENITDKKGNFIETKTNLIKVLNNIEIEQETSGGIGEHGTTPSTPLTPSSSTVETPRPEWPKNVGGVILREEEKNKLVLKLRVKEGKAEITFRNPVAKPQHMEDMLVELGDGTTKTIKETGITQFKKEYNQGEYIIKVSSVEHFRIGNFGGTGNYEIEILQWGKIKEQEELTSLTIDKVSKIYEPEPDKVVVNYVYGVFSKIPENLFSKKKTSKKSSKFYMCEINEIPEELFKECKEMENFEDTFNRCEKIQTIPEDLFKYNLKANKFTEMFTYCTKLVEIPDKIVQKMLQSTTNIENYRRAFGGCTNAKNYNDIPNAMKYY